MLIFYDIFYRRFGIRKAPHLITPPMPLLTLLELPKKSILHYVGSSHQDTAPSATDYLFRNINKPIYVQHITEIGDHRGNPRKVAIPVEQNIRQFHLKNRRFFRSKGLQAATRDDNTLLIYNYGFIDQQYKYMRSLYADYYRWWNTEAAVWSNIATVAKETERQHFVMLNVPQVLPSLSELRLGCAGVSNRMLQIFNDREEWMVLELWKWFGEERSDSVLSALDESALAKVNIVYQESGRWIVFNLGQINQWRKTPKQELDKTASPITDGFEATLLQRRYLHLMMVLTQLRNADQVITPEQVLADAQAKAKDDVEQAAKQTPEQGQEPVEGTQPSIKPILALSPKPLVNPALINEVPLEQLEPADTGKDIKLLEHVEKNIEQDLAQLEALSKSALGKVKPEESEPEVKEAVVVQEVTTDNGVKQVCDRLADSGLLSAAEYRRYNELAASYKSLKAPNGKQTLAEFINIKPEELKLSDQTKIADIPAVVDKSMLTSSLLEFDQKYTSQILHRDVASMVLGVQKAGIAVTGYDVEREEDVMGVYDSYAVRINPVEGAASTIRFKLPVVQDDGTYTANGVRYRMRKQRGDVPIRKLTPSRVALTSYYGKVFVSRSDKKVNDYGHWLTDQIMLKGLDKADTSVTDMHPANVFDNLFVCPRLYSILASSFRSFTVKLGEKQVSFDLNFEHGKRLAYYGEDVLKQYEQNGSIVFGTNDKGQYLVMDKLGALYLGSQGQLLEIGTIEELVGLDAFKAPVDFAEVKILGRTIPVGLVLAYQLGLDKLLQELEITPRRVPVGTRVNLQSDEFSLVFSDETLVFSKDNQMAAMVLAGFNEYHRAIRQYSVYDFDRRGVYLNVLESGGNSARYLREIDLLYQMFIDPITRDLLVEMNEPLTFHGLLKRSCELLLVDQHPDELDPAYMRIKGYERMAGAVYSELVRSIRGHNARPGKSRIPIDLNPYAVWTNISEDPSKAQVSDINPIQNLKEVEAVTYNGVGGRSSRSMTKATRIYHRNDMGTISESTTDDDKVGVNFYTSANPKFTSVRGLSERFDLNKPEAASLLSTSALISPGSDRDD